MKRFSGNICTGKREDNTGSGRPNGPDYLDHEGYRAIARDLMDCLEDGLDLSGMTVELRAVGNGVDRTELFALREIPQSLQKYLNWG